MPLQVWSTLPTAEVLAQAAANTVRPAFNTRGSAYAAAVAAGLDPQLLYDYRCRVLNMVKAHYGESSCRRVGSACFGRRPYELAGFVLVISSNLQVGLLPTTQQLTGFVCRANSLAAGAAFDFDHLVCAAFNC